MRKKDRKVEFIRLCAQSDMRVQKITNNDGQIRYVAPTAKSVIDAKERRESEGREPTPHKTLLEQFEEYCGGKHTNKEVVAALGKLNAYSMTMVDEITAEEYIEFAIWFIGNYGKNDKLSMLIDETWLFGPRVLRIGMELFELRDHEDAEKAYVALTSIGKKNADILVDYIMSMSSEIIIRTKYDNGEQNCWESYRIAPAGERIEEYNVSIHVKGLISRAIENSGYIQVHTESDGEASREYAFLANKGNVVPVTKAMSISIPDLESEYVCMPTITFVKT